MESSVTGNINTALITIVGLFLGFLIWQVQRASTAIDSIRSDHVKRAELIDLLKEVQTLRAEINDLTRQVAYLQAKLDSISRH